MGFTMAACDSLVDSIKAQGYDVPDYADEHVNDRAKLIMAAWLDAKGGDGSALLALDYNTMIRRSFAGVSGNTEAENMGWNDAISQDLTVIKQEATQGAADSVASSFVTPGGLESSITEPAPPPDTFQTPNAQTVNP